MKRYLFETIRQFLINKRSDDNDGFLLFLVKKNHSKLYLFIFFAIFVLIFVLIYAEITNEYTDIIWAHSILLIFSAVWLFILRMRKKTLNHKSQWLFLIPSVVYILYISYLLGFYSYRSVFFSGYTTVIFILSVIYTTKWQTTAWLFASSIGFLQFLTPYGKTGPSNYASSNIITVGIILTAAWFVSRFIYLIYKNEYESRRDMVNARATIQSERDQNTQLNQTIQTLKGDFEERINQRTKELNEAKIKAEESDRTKALFLANMSHELRTPLSGIIGTLEILNDPDINEDEKASLIKMALESSGELKRIIDELMEISRLRSGHFEMENVPFDPKRLFLQCTNLFKNSAKEKGIAFQVDFQNLPKEIISEPRRIKQIVDNLLGNAVKFTDEGFIRSTFRLVSHHDKGDCLMITVKDSGIGMDEKTQRRLFDYFFQEDDSLKKKYTGIGLGLALVKHYVQQFEGVINLDSLKNKGTQFELNIPVKRPEISKTPPLQEIKKGTIPGTVKSVLIVEDNRINRFILRKILQEYQIKVYEAENGEKAIQVFKDHSIDLIFMDIQMPIMDGYEAMKEIHKIEKKREIPIVAITGYASTEDKKRIMDIGFDDYLAKPFEKEDIINCIQKTQQGDYNKKKRGNNK